jgi:hypothetical protein
MSNDENDVRTELERKFQPPIDVLLDPSLLVSRRSLQQLSDSTVFDSQTQATLGRTLTEPRLGDLYVPASFRDLVAGSEQSSAQKTDVWDFYRGQAEAAFPEDVREVLEENGVRSFDEKPSQPTAQLGDAIDGSDRDSRLVEVLREELSFISTGGLVLSRTTTVFDGYRSSGIPTVALGNAALTARIEEALEDIGYESPANVCVFGVSSAEATIDALVGDLLTSKGDLLLYQLGG